MLGPANRRKLLIVALAIAGSFTELGRSVIRMTKAFARPGDRIDPSTRAAMVRMARLLYPHQAISNEVYAEVLDQAAVSFAGSPSFGELLQSAETALNAQQPQRWIDLDEQRQIAAMKAIERTDFFTVIRTAVQTKLYNHPAVWAVLGYEGPSFEKGGYIDRGAGSIDWLPKA